MSMAALRFICRSQRRTRESFVPWRYSRTSGSRSLSRAGGPGRVALAVDDTGDRAVEGFDPGRHRLTDGVVVAGGGIGVVGVEAFDAPGGAAHSPAGAVGSVGRNQGVALGGVAAMGRLQPSAEIGIGPGLGLHPLDASRSLQAADPIAGQGTR